MNRFYGPASDIASTIFIRLAVGVIFFTQGILKYIDLRARLRGADRQQRR